MHLVRWGGGLIPMVSGSVVDPDSVGSLDPYPVTDSQSGSRRAKKTHKHRRKLIKFMFWSAGCSLSRADGFSLSLDILYGGIGIRRLDFWSKKDWKKNFQLCFFLQFLVMKTMDTDPDSDLLEMPDPYSMNPENQWIRIHISADHAPLILYKIQKFFAFIGKITTRCIVLFFSNINLV